MSAGALSQVILGSLIFRPNFLELGKLDENLFSGRERGAFQVISELWEDKRPPEIDVVLLAERLGGW